MMVHCTGRQAVFLCVLLMVILCMITYVKTPANVTNHFLPTNAGSIGSSLVHSPGNFASRLLKDSSEERTAQAASTTQTPQGPIQRVVFLKTHKTGSSTIASIFQRYGYLNEHTFLIPECKHVLSTNERFSISKIKTTSTDWNYSVGFDFLTNHARYNRPEMNRVFHGSVYVTILRDPTTQFESSFYYFEMYRFLPAGNNTIGAFLANPDAAFKIMRRKNKALTERRMHNQQIFDLGVDLDDMDNDQIIASAITQFDRDFNLVMITEYFDESIVLLSKLLRWSLDDVRHIAMGIRSPSYRPPLTDDLRGKVHSWNTADHRLYQHFNRTFWEKVQAYGPSFDEDLEIFRQRQQELRNTCCDDERIDRRDRRVVNFILKDDAPEWCSNFTRNDVQFTSLIRKRMRKMGIPPYDTCGSNPLKKQP